LVGAEDRCLRHDENAPQALIPDRRKGPLDIVGPSDLQGEKCHADGWSGGLESLQLERALREGRIQEDGDTRRRRDDLLEKLEAFGDGGAVKV
jgi:hypothetical protein